MPLSTIKPEFAKHYVAFGLGKKPLGERADIDELAIIALESGDETLLEKFDKLPSLQELKNAKTDAQLSKQPAPAVKANNNNGK